MKQIPEFLQNLYNDTQKETRPFSKIFAFINLSEAVIKFYTVVTVQNFLETETGNPSLEEGKAVLGKGLARPSLGLWAFFTERITGLIHNDKFFWENFPDFFEKDLKPATAILVNLRNKYHHGAVPSNEECTKDLNEAEPYLKRILFEGLIGEDRILIGNVIQNAKAKEVFLERADGRRLELSPLMHAEFSNKSKKEELYYFNDAKKWDKGTINTMSYDVGEHVSNKEIFDEFRKTFPIPDWEKSKVSRFANRISELTENFQGRDSELSKIKNFLTESSQGYIFIWGGPGIGKSALIARSLVLVRAGLEEKTQLVESGFDLGTKEIIVLEYFIRRATLTEKEDSFYSMLGEDLEEIFKTGISMGNNLQEKKEKWKARLEKIQRKLNGSEDLENDEDEEESENTKKSNKNKTKEDPFKGKKLIICIDGLDEGEEGILKSIPRGSDLYSDILFVLGGRDVTQTRTLYTTLDADKKTEIVLQGLKEVDIRAIMLKVANSDTLTPDYIAKLMKVSEGNPLYLKMICDSIERKERIAGDLENLPAGVDNLYDGIYERFSKLKDSELLLKILYFFTFAKDFLSVDVVAYFLHLEYFRAEFLVGEIREVLWENPMTEDVDDFQLFHESLRDYLRKKYDRERFGVQKMILDGLAGWRVLCEEGIDPRTANYILQYAVTHLLEEGEQKQAERFVLDSEFLKNQVEYLNFYTVSLDDAVNVLDAIVEELGGKPGTARPLEEIFKPKIEGEEYRTTTLVRLVDHAGELGHRASKDIGIAWTWVEEGKVAEALERLSPIQDKQRLFDCYLLALWLLTQQKDGEANRAELKLVLEEVEKNIPPAESKSVKWHMRYSLWFFENIVQTLLERDQDVKWVFDRGEDEEKRDVILNWLGYEKFGNEYEQYNFKEKKDIFQQYISKFIPFSRGIEHYGYHNEALGRIVETVTKLGEVELVKSLFPVLFEEAREFEDNENSSKLLISILESISKIGEADLGKNLFPVFFEVISKFEDSEYRSRLLITLVESVVKLGDVDFGKNLLQEAVEVARGIEDSYSRSRAISCIVESVAKLGDVEFAKDLSQEALEVARGIEDFYSRSRAISNIGESVAKLGDVDFGKNLLQEAVEVARRIESSNKLTDALSSIGESVAKLGELELGKNFFQEAMEVARGIERSDYRSSSLRSLGDSVSKLGDVELGKSLFRKAIDAARVIEDSFHRTFYLSIICDSVLKLADEELGRSLYPELVEVVVEFEHSDYSVNFLISVGESVSKLGDVELGKSLFRMAIENARGIDNTYGLQPITLISIWESVSKLRNVDLGKSLFPLFVEVAQGIKDSGERSISLSSIGKSISKLGDIELGNRLFPVLVQQAHAIESFDYRSRYISSLGKSISKLGDIELGNRLFPVLVGVARGIDNKFGYLSDVLRSLGESVWTLDMELGKKLFQDAVEVARGIESFENRSHSLSSIGESIWKLGYLELGKSLLEDAMKVSRTFEDSCNRSSSLNNLWESVWKLGDVELGKSLLEEALKVTRGIESFKYRSRSISNIGESIWKLGDVELGKNLFPVLVEVARGFEDSEYRSNSLSSIGESVSKLGDVEIGKNLFPVLVEVARGIEDSEYRRRALSSIGESISKLGDIELGKRLFPLLIEFARGINNLNYRSEALSNLGVLLSLLKEFNMCIYKKDSFEKIKKIFKFKNSTKKIVNLLIQEAVEVTCGIESSNSRSRAIISIGESVAKLGDVELGKSLFPELVGVVRVIEDIDYRIRSLINIGELVSKMGDLEFGKSLIHEALEIARGIKDSNKLSNSLSSLGESIWKLGDVELGKSLLEEAVEVARKGDNTYGSQSNDLIILGESIWKLGDMEFGKNLLQEALHGVYGIEDSADRRRSLWFIARYMSNFGETEFSIQILSQIFEMALQMKVSNDRRNVISDIAKATSTFGSTSVYSIFETNHESHPDLPEVVKSYTEKYREIRWEEPTSYDLFPYYIRSYKWVPLDGEFAKKGAYDLVSTFAKLGKLDEALEAFYAIPYNKKNENN